MVQVCDLRAFAWLTAIAPNADKTCLSITHRYVAAGPDSMRLCMDTHFGNAPNSAIMGRHVDKLAESPRSKGSMEFHLGVVYRFLKVFSRLVAYHPASANGRFLVRLRVAPHASVLLPHLEEPKRRRMTDSPLSSDSLKVRILVSTSYFALTLLSPVSSNTKLMMSIFVKGILPTFFPEPRTSFG